MRVNHYPNIPRKNNHKKHKQSNQPISINMDLESIIISDYKPLMISEINGPEQERWLISYLTRIIPKIELPYQALMNIKWTTRIGKYEVDLLQLILINNELGIARYEVKTKTEDIGKIRKQLTNIRGVLPVLVELTSNPETRIQQLIRKGFYDFAKGAILIDYQLIPYAYFNYN